MGYRSGGETGDTREKLSSEASPYGDVSIVKGNLWTSSQRKSSSIHEISYRACFKAELPEFFISRYTGEGDVVYDPFMGRGTTLVEAALNGRIPFGTDINPLSKIFTVPRLDIATEKEIIGRIDTIPLLEGLTSEVDISMFFHPDTESEIVSLRNYFISRDKEGTEDRIDRFIRMVATNRLTGHSPGFFSVYTLPPNQAASQSSQKRINRRLEQEPSYRDVRKILRKKVHSLFRSLDSGIISRMNSVGKKGGVFSADSRDTEGLIPDNEVSLTVTSPPFLDTVQYVNDNWMRLWFNNLTINNRHHAPFVTPNLQSWKKFIGSVFADLYRVTRDGGRVAFEVGEVRRGTLDLAVHVADAGKEAGFELESLFINAQTFTKTSNIWGVRNNKDGTNSNRIVLFRKQY